MMSDARAEYPSGTPWATPPGWVEAGVPLDIVAGEPRPDTDSDRDEVPIVARAGRGRAAATDSERAAPDALSEAYAAYVREQVAEPERDPEPAAATVRPEPREPALSAEGRALQRKRHLVPVHFMVSSDVPRAVAQAALAGTTDALIGSGQERQLVEVQPQRGKPYTDADWYIDNALARQEGRRDAGYGSQVYLEEVLDLIALAEPHERPHWKVLVTAQDLTAEGLNFAFGATTPDTASTVQSVRRFMEAVPESRLQSEMIRRLFRHEFGHLLGLPSAHRPNTEENLGNHCTNLCTMRQGLSTVEWAELTVEEVENGTHFCTDCRMDLAERRPRYLPLPPQ